MKFIDKIKVKREKKKWEKLSDYDKVISTTFDYSSFDLSLERKLNASKEEFIKINEIVTNNKLQMNKESLKYLNEGLTKDNYYYFYDAWITEYLHANNFIAVCEFSTPIEEFVKSVNLVMRNCGYNLILDSDEMLKKYMDELNKMGVSKRIDFFVLVTNVVLKELRKHDLELFSFFSGFDNYDFVVISKSKFEELQKYM